MNPRFRNVLRKSLSFYLTRRKSFDRMVSALFLCFSLLTCFTVVLSRPALPGGESIIKAFTASLLMFAFLECFRYATSINMFLADIDNRSPARQRSLDHAISLLEAEKMKATSYDLWGPLPWLVRLAYDRETIAEADRAHLAGKTKPARGKSRPPRL